MREIKFRAWLKETKEMIPVDQIDFNNSIINSESAWRMGSEYILEQFTSLHDKNGVEIYEGDIVMVRSGWDEKAVIIYSDELARFMAKFKKFGNKSISQETVFEVIGNIHDNPELLT